MNTHPKHSVLQEAALEIVSALGGTWRGNGAMCRCPAHRDSIPSLSVRVGDSNILFKCFAGCATADVMQAIRAARLRLPQQEVGNARQFGGLDSNMSERALEIWKEAMPLLRSPGQSYLEARAITRFPPALRFHPRTPVGSGRSVRFRPAVIAALHQRRRFVALQRIFLDQDARDLATNMERPRLTLGRPLRGAVMLAAAGPLLGLAEGVETALSASILLDIPVWATLGSERFANIELPPSISRLILCPDADRAGRLAARRASLAYSGQGFAVETYWPWHGLNDWNDVLRQGGEGKDWRLRKVA